MLVAGWLKEGTFEYHEAHIGFLKHHAIMHVQANNSYFILYVHVCVCGFLQAMRNFAVTEKQ